MAGVPGNMAGGLENMAGIPGNLDGGLGNMAGGQENTPRVQETW